MCCCLAVFFFSFCVVGQYTHWQVVWRTYLWNLLDEVCESDGWDLDMRSLTGRQSLIRDEAGSFYFDGRNRPTVDFTSPLVVIPCHLISLRDPNAPSCMMLKLFVVAFHLWSLASSLNLSCKVRAAAGHGRNLFLLGVKRAEQTDQRITQRLDTLAVYLREEPTLRSQLPNRCKSPSVFKLEKVPTLSSLPWNKLQSFCFNVDIFKINFEVVI